MNKLKGLAVKLFDLPLLKQEALLRLALKEKGLNYKKLKIEIDHDNGINVIEGLRCGIVYPVDFFIRAARISGSKEYKYYFNGNMSASGRRKDLLDPFIGDETVIIESNDGRSILNKSKFNLDYYLGLSKAWYGLCPHQLDWTGSLKSLWTYRVIECCMVKTIPLTFKETPLSDEFLEGITFTTNEQPILDAELVYKDVVNKNYKNALDKFTLSNEIIDSIKGK